MIASLVLALTQLAAASEPSGDALGDLIETLSAAPGTAENPLACNGAHRQGAALICRTAPGAQVQLGDIVVSADQAGWVVLGHDRDAAPQTEVRITLADNISHMQMIEVEQREYNIQRIEGTPTRFNNLSDEDRERSRREGAIKAAAYTSRWDGQGFLSEFEWPLEGTITGVYGSQRFYNGDPSRPHYGIDIAAPSGAEIIAPASGVVTLANDDMFWEGGLIFIDHGQGFTSAFLHLSSVSVEVGDVVERGQVIGEVGAGGRSTGAHLDWRIKWHNRYIDPESTLELDLDALR